MTYFNHKSAKILFPVFILVFLIVYVLGADFLQLKSYNFMVKLTQNNKMASEDVVLVVIDDKSLYEIDRWPWKRDLYLEIFDYLENYTKAKLIGYDGLIVAPDVEHPESDKKFFSSIKKYKKLVTALAFSNDAFENDVNEKEYDDILKSKPNVKVLDKRTEKKHGDNLKSFTVLQEEYFKNVNMIAAVNVPEDIDGYVRKACQLMYYKGIFYPSLALLMHSKLTGIQNYVLTDTHIWAFSDNYILKIPVEDDNDFISNYICFYKMFDNFYSHKKYSASDIIKSYRAIKKGEKPILDSSVFDNKVVFVGANAQAQALYDVQRTPISETFSGVDIQATNFDNLITNNFYTLAPKLYNLFICIIVFVLIFIIISLMSSYFSLLSCFIAAFCYFAFSYFMYFNKVAVNLFLPELYILIAMICAYSYKYLMEDYKKSKIQNAMGKYLSYDVMQNVVKNIDNVELGGKRQDITVLFADIRNFTSISESMDPNSTTMILNEYFSAMVPIVEKNNGVLNKFMGDAILVVFGEPKKSENHALDAINCGYSMLKKVKMLQEKWIEEGKPRIEIGIGVCSGEAFIGNIGSNDRLEYTVIGDTVNTASRIENYNKVYRTNFLISESTYLRVKDYIDAIVIRDVVIRGKSGTINLYEVVKLNDKNEL